MIPRDAVISCDILVVGAGSAGVSAAVAAARAGASTLLVERHEFPGGTAILGMHRAICGLFTNAGDAPPGLLNEGLTVEVVARLGRRAASRPITRMGRVYVLPCLTDDLERLFRDLIRGEEKLRAFFRAEAVAVKRRGRKVHSVILRDASGAFTVVPKALIDCTGDGVVIQWSGAGYREAPPAKRQLAGFVIRVKDLSVEDPMLPVKVPYYLARAAAARRFPRWIRFTSYAPGDAGDEGYCKLNLPPWMERREQALEMAEEVHRYLASVLEPFRPSSIAAVSREVMQRDGPRLAGEYQLTARDVLTGRRFPDGVVRSAWPIEFWDQGKGQTLRYLESPDFYEIPARCLRSPDVDNLFAGGRCISCSPQALASTRVAGVCLALGEAAAREAVRSIG